MSATAERKPRRPGSATVHGSVDRQGVPWRGLDELASDPDVRRFAEAEFPALADRLGAPVDRRTLMKVMGASLALGGLAGCNQAEHIVPYVRQPEEVVPGRPRFYATALGSGGYGIGALVESHEGRPTKVEGNPDHPASRGATDAVMQAAVLALFDPDRSRIPLKAGAEAGMDEFLHDMAGLVARLRETDGAGTALVVDPAASPTLAAGLTELRSHYPHLAVFGHDPLAVVAAEVAATTLYGRPLVPHYRFDRAAVILSLDADFLGEGPGRLAHAADYAERRRVRRPEDGMSRHYAVESTPTITGAAADHRKSLRPDQVDRLAAVLRGAIAGEPVPEDAPVDPVWLRALVCDLRGAGRSALVVPGPHQSPFVHAVAIAANSALGAIGHTLTLIEPPLALPLDGDLATLCSAIAAGRITRVVVLGADPVATSTAELDVAALFSRLEQLIHLGVYRNRTADLASWHVPAAHELESWGDLRAYDGTVSVVQPLVRPLYGGLTAHEVIAVLAGQFGAAAHDIVRAHWRERLDEQAWREALRSGVVPDTAAAPISAHPSNDFGGLEPQDAAADGLVLRFVADPFLRDGRHANSAWLQELPRPLTKMVWGNAALVSPATAAARNLDNGDVVSVQRSGRSIDAAIWAVPGAADGTVTLSLGYGRSIAGSVAALAAGYDAYRLRTAEAFWHGGGAELMPTGRTARVLTTQHHHSMEGRHIVRHATLDEFRANPHFVRQGVPPPPQESVYPEWEYPYEKWAMSVDTAACIGCMACVAACQAENNIATVGPEECARGREMHWLRVDRYYEGPPEEPETYLQPVPCMHCEKAPCEVVCPVNATVHTHDGLNAQIYNRCVGTRYCSQNCPYKVRRFNFLDTQVFDKEAAGPKKAVHNPDVSIRQRGVMEKCTYCVQRISAARIEARKDNRAIRDGEVVTACQQACPTRAIVFGDVNDPQAKVAGEKAASTDYGLLEELNTRPRTTYLADIRNPNPRLTPKRRRESADG